MIFLMEASELKTKFLDFFVKKGHKKLPNVSLVPENDPTALFISAGMHPLVPYLLGEPHPLGKKLVSLQRCLRTDDIEYVGDGFHHTFFEMLGNWSLGDYWKKEAILLSWEFLTKVLKINPQKISVSCFAGDKDAPKDAETAKIWQSVGLPKERIFFLGKKENWWGPVGESGPCGPDTEMFFDTGKKKCGPRCSVACQCGKYIEIWNNVFMEYNRRSDGKYEPLKQKNVDTGMGVERTAAVLNGLGDDDYRTELFWPIIQKIEKISGQKYDENKKTMRIIVDHLRAAAFLMADGVEPSNKDQGYVLRRLIRRVAVKMMQFKLPLLKEAPKIYQKTVGIYQDEYFKKNDFIKTNLIFRGEIDAFLSIIHKATKLLQTKKNISGKLLFDLYQTNGLPFEIALELLAQWGKTADKRELEKEFNQELKKHQKLSKKGVEKKFAGGLVDRSKTVTKLHTATHLLHQALRDVLGKHVKQIGSNITTERLRFDFTHPEKLTEAQIKKVRMIVNQKIKEDLPVKMEIMSVGEAKKLGALAFFTERYGEKVKVYSIGNYSKEVCGGPHVASTDEIDGVKIIKEESVGAGRRRIYARLAQDGS